jgi:hypothetical protein
MTWSYSIVRRELYVVGRVLHAREAHVIVVRRQARSANGIYLFTFPAHDDPEKFVFLKFLYLASRYIWVCKNSYTRNVAPVAR